MDKQYLQSFVVKVEPFAGQHVRDICSDMVALADRIGCRVEAECNGVTVWARPGDDARLLYASVVREISSDSKIKIAQAD